MVDTIRTAQDGGWEFLRVRFVIWPGQGSLIETAFRPQILKLMKTHDPNYADWQIAVLYRALAM